MRVILNGEPRELPLGSRVEQAVALTGAPAGGAGIAVALEGEVVPRGRWAAVELRDGQRIEILQAVQGG